MKKILMIIAFQDFRDEELFIPRSIFLNNGYEVKIASVKKGEAVGTYGGVVNVDFSFDELDVSDFDAIVFVGGSGAINYLDNEKAHSIAKQAIKENKLLAGICIAPAILARSGVLKGKKATVWSNEMDKSGINILKQEKVDYQQDCVVIDGNIITANGPKSARAFGEEIVKKLDKE